MINNGFSTFFHLDRMQKISFITILIIFLISACSPSIPKLDYEPEGDYNLDQYIYSIDLNYVENDRVYVHLHCSGLNQETVIFHFPKTIPGTYKELDYGEMIEVIEPRDSQGNILSTEKIGKNTFKIVNAFDLNSIHYWIEDTWDHPKAKYRIWPMGGTNIEENQNFVINASGWFGFFEGLEMVPVQLTIDYPEGMESFTALPVINNFDKSVTFQARDYHHLIDCPIIISEPDTATFMVSNTKVFIEAFSDGNDKLYSEVIKKEIQPSMEAVLAFTDLLPVDEYHFIMYIRDGEEIFKTIQSKDVGIIKKAKTVFKNISMLGMGALEHGNSSFYALTDFGDSSYISIVKRVALHEFMHIYTPLNLHSEFIGDFDYINPKMSKHLWLYEGVTEYFAHLIMLQSGLVTPVEFFQDQIRTKIKRASSYPEKKIPFTVMSEKVFERKYGRYYNQVYERGAIIGLLLDIEIIRLTNGDKTLKDVIIDLSSKYGTNQSFNENTFFDEFTKLVHPDLRNWFSKYVEGSVPLDIKGGLEQIGIEYSDEGKNMIPKSILRDYGSKSSRFSLGRYIKVKKVGKKDPIGFIIGDEIDKKKLNNVLYDDFGYPVEEGEEVKIVIKRNNEIIELPYLVEHKKQKYKHRLRILKQRTDVQEYLYNIWIGLK